MSGSPQDLITELNDLLEGIPLFERTSMLKAFLQTLTKHGVKATSQRRYLGLFHEFQDLDVLLGRKESKSLESEPNKARTFLRKVKEIGFLLNDVNKKYSKNNPNPFSEDEQNAINNYIASIFGDKYELFTTIINSINEFAEKGIMVTPFPDEHSKTLETIGLESKEKPGSKKDKPVPDSFEGVSSELLEIIKTKLNIPENFLTAHMVAKQRGHKPPYLDDAINNRHLEDASAHNSFKFISSLRRQIEEGTSIENIARSFHKAKEDLTSNDQKACEIKNKWPGKNIEETLRTAMPDAFDRFKALISKGCDILDEIERKNKETLYGDKEPNPWIKESGEINFKQLALSSALKNSDRAP